MRKLAFIALAFTLAAHAADLETRVRGAVSGTSPDTAVLRELGARALPVLVRLYNTSDEAHRTTIAVAFYQLGIKSADAKAALMKDVHTENESLRLQVQWALGRVSDDADVVDVLADIMQHDGSALFRDKAACALANDQIHLTEKQKVQLYTKVIKALRDPKLQVRQIAIQVLQIQTGQTKGFSPNASIMVRENSVQQWEKWLAEYSANWR